MLRMSIKSSSNKQGKTGVPDADLTKKGFKLLTMQTKRSSPEGRDT
jgi:hypothetical protein